MAKANARAARRPSRTVSSSSRKASPKAAVRRSPVAGKARDTKASSRAKAKARGTKARPRAAAARPASTSSPLFAPVAGAERRDIGRVQLEVGRAGAARVKRMIYPVGFRWSVDMKPAIGGALCMHAHVGFLAHGEIHIEYADGCVIEHKAPQIVAIEPGHDGWVVGRQPVVMIEFDFEGQTVERLGMPAAHRHA
jgi:hypothetical protein